MRRIGFFILALCLTVGTVGLVGCGGEDAGGSGGGASTGGSDDGGSDDGGSDDGGEE